MTGKKSSGPIVRKGEWSLLTEKHNGIYTDWWLTRHGKVERRKLSMLIPKCGLWGGHGTLN